MSGLRQERASALGRMKFAVKGKCDLDSCLTSSIQKCVADATSLFFKGRGLRLLMFLDDSRLSRATASQLLVGVSQSVATITQHLLLFTYCGFFLK